MSFKQTLSSKGTIFFVSVLCIAVLGVPTLHAQIITTVAGNGTAGYSGDDGPATSASLNEPASVALDGLGNLFIAEFAGHRIRHVDGVTGVITTVAGNGTAGYGGDGGPATSASLNKPVSVAVDSLGNLFVADQSNHRIRRVDGVTGIIITVAGNGVAGFGGDGGPGGGASLNSPAGVAVDGLGNLLIADTGNHRIRRVDGVTGIIVTVVGNGERGYSGDWTGVGLPPAPTEASLNFPSGVAVDASGTLFIADSANHRIRVVPLGFLFIYTIAGNGVYGFCCDGGPATSASLQSPESLAVDGAANLFIADTGNHRIRRVDGVTGIIQTVAGNGGTGGFCCDGGPATSAQLYFPLEVAMDAVGNLFIADWQNHRIRKVAPAP